MNKIFILIFFLIFTANSRAEYFEAKYDGCSDNYSYLVLNENGHILFEQNSTNMSYPASLVKLMTLYLTFEALEEDELKPNQILKVSERGEEISKVNKITTLNLEEGDEITVREAIRGLIVKSFNEAAVTLAEAVLESEWRFVRAMNKKAKELGMFNTSFRNASGLHAEGQYTTSYDLARLVIALKKDFPEYYHLFSLEEFEYGDKKYITHNHVLVDYPGAEGLKTGFTSASGFNLISAAMHDNKRIISIMLGCSTYQERDYITKEMLDDAFEKMEEEYEKQPKTKLEKKFSYIAKQRKCRYNEAEIRLGMKKN